MLSFDEKIDYFKNRLNKDADFIVRQLTANNKKLCLMYLKSMIDKQILSEGILNSILLVKEDQEISLSSLGSEIVVAVTSDEIETNNEAVIAILKNYVVAFVENEDKFLKFYLEKYPTRMPTEPPTSAVVKLREGFTESIKTNIALIRRRLPTESLVLEDVFVGKYTNTQVTLAYLDNVANKKIIKKIKERIEKIDIDGIIDSNYISQFLEERPFSMFKQVGSAEKPDVIASKMLEGRVAIFVDNSPVVLTLPFIYFEEIQSSNDYYGKYQYSIFIRFIRLFGVFLSIILPSLYLTVRLYHYKIIPLQFLVTITSSTQTLPFTPFIELVFILLLFETLYEVSLRLPRYIGLATSVVGALILGQTGVDAGLISAPTVMIVAISVIAVYAVPDQAFQMALLRWVFILLGAALGIYGIIAGIIYFAYYLNTLNAYGAPYLAPFAPFVKNDFANDSLFKSDITRINKRPQSFKNKNKVRLENDE